MGALGDVARDFVEVGLRGVSVGVGQRAAGPGHRAEQIGVVVALVGGCLGRIPRLAHCRTWPFFWPMRASSSEPDFNRRRLGQAADMSSASRAGSFFESLDGPLVLSWMTGPRTDVGGPVS